MAQTSPLWQTTLQSLLCFSLTSCVSLCELPSNCKKKLLGKGPHPAWVRFLTIIKTFASESLAPNYGDLEQLGNEWRWQAVLRWGCGDGGGKQTSKKSVSERLCHYPPGDLSYTDI